MKEYTWEDACKFFKLLNKKEFIKILENREHILHDYAWDYLREFN